MRAQVAEVDGAHGGRESFAHPLLLQRNTAALIEKNGSAVEGRVNLELAPPGDQGVPPKLEMSTLLGQYFFVASHVAFDAWTTDGSASHDAS